MKSPPRILRQVLNDVAARSPELRLFDAQTPADRQSERPAPAALQRFVAQQHHTARRARTAPRIFPADMPESLRLKLTPRPRRVKETRAPSSTPRSKKSKPTLTEEERAYVLRFADPPRAFPYREDPLDDELVPEPDGPTVADLDRWDAEWRDEWEDDSLDDAEAYAETPSEVLHEATLLDFRWDEVETETPDEAIADEDDFWMPE